MRIAPGSKGLSSEALRLSNSVPASYTVYKDGSTYYAEANSPGLSDNSDSDAYTLIQWVISALPNGGKILIKRGTYNLGAALTSTASNFIIEGEGTGTILTTDAPAMDMIYLGDSAHSAREHMGVRNLKITSNVEKTDGAGIMFDANQTVGGILGASTSFVDNVYIDNMWQGIEVLGTTGLHITNSNIFRSEDIGIKIYGVSGEVHMSNLVIDCPSACLSGNKESATAGIYWRNSLENFISNVHVARSELGLYIDSTAAASPSGSGIINGLNASDNYGGGVKIVGEATNGPVLGITFNGCQFNTNGMLNVPNEASHGVEIDNLSGGVVAGFMFDGCQFYQNGGHGLYLNSGTNILVNNCEFINNGKFVADTYSGVYVDGISDWHISNSFFRNDGYGGSGNQYYALDNQGAGDWYSFINNSIRSFSHATKGINGHATGVNKNISGNLGFLTENKGTGSVANGGTTSGAISHGLAVTPSAEHFTIIGKESPTNDLGAVYVDTITATEFTVHTKNDPGVSNWDFGWKVIVI